MKVNKTLSLDYAAVQYLAEQENASELVNNLICTRMRQEARLKQKNQQKENKEPAKPPKLLYCEHCGQQFDLNQQEDWPRMICTTCGKRILVPRTMSKEVKP